MRLTLYSDYSLRVMIYLGLHDRELSSIRRISEAYRISRNHLVKVVHNLGKLGYVHTVRGRGGGIRLGRRPSEINIGELVRLTESSSVLVECFDPKRNRCRLTPACVLKRILAEAQSSFFDVLSNHTLADLLLRPETQITLLQVGIRKGRGLRL